jgi:hypothetical protein
MRLRAPWLVGVAVVLQVAIKGVDSTDSWPFVALATSYGIMGLWLVLNLGEGPRERRSGFGLVAFGYALNLAAILPNGSMPVSVAALRRVGSSTAAFHRGPNLDKHVAAGAATLCAWLGDVVPLRGLGVVISVGDIVMLVGVVIVLSAGMTSWRCSPMGAP